ncbi:iron ABC transporter permease [Thiospirochaeta perfilievii]|uniref:Iron ABC transporter permease n=1 Tax=Thiospirochaeta perfilievii TaxID=252967 RepID=A0A5C1QFG3_9SPIO|nr:iron chelate uptake ABC transporter family permease subunit [Thiospirochaeta perfilievii]QEN05326.1 iron ABC transporter permease [Thiospirochaeta perfilievii]
MVKRSLLIIISIISIVATIFLSLAFGARDINFIEVLDTLIHTKKETLIQVVIWERVPRTIFGLIAGLSLGVSGALMQGITRNPIADPSVLGVNTGASLFVVIGIVFFNINSAFLYILLAILGAFSAAIFVYVVGSLGFGGVTPIKLALAGTVTSIALTSVTNAIVLPNAENLNSFRFWSVGSLSGATYQGILAMIPFFLIGLLIAFIISNPLNALALGDELATGLGARPTMIRLLGAISGVILCGSVTAIAGPIGFIGLMVPHVIKIIVGTNQKLLLPYSGIGGALLLLNADILGRVIGTPSELEVGIITAFIGAPILIVIVMRSKVDTK